MEDFSNILPTFTQGIGLFLAISAANIFAFTTTIIANIHINRLSLFKEA